MKANKNGYLIDTIVVCYNSDMKDVDIRMVIYWYGSALTTSNCNAPTIIAHRGWLLGIFTAQKVVDEIHLCADYAIQNISWLPDGLHGRISARDYFTVSSGEKPELVQPPKKTWTDQFMETIQSEKYKKFAQGMWEYYPKDIADW